MPVISGPGAVSDFKPNSGPNLGLPPNGPRTECAGCGAIILDKYYLLAVDRSWHSHCLKCAQCKVSLDSEATCFSRQGHIYCKEDYYKIFAVKRCTRCGQGIYASDLVMKVRDNIYHLNCFTCAWCNITLTQGDYFGIKNNLVYCRTHLEMHTSSGSNGCHGSVGCGAGGDYFLTSENAIHPSPVGDHCHPGDAIGGLPAYGSIYGSPGSGGLNGGGGPGAAGGGGAIHATGGVRKGRPRKRKSAPGADAGSAGNCSLHEGGLNAASASQGPPNLSGTVGCTVDGLGGPLHEASTPNGQQASCHVTGLNSGGQSQRTKRMRTSFKHHQLRTMKQYFAINQNPDAKDLKQLAQKTGLSKRVLQVWFQNARAKWRRNNLKMQDQQASGDPSTQSDLLQPHSVLNPETPSTGVGSPEGSSTRQFSSPCPSLGGGHEQSLIGNPGSNGSSLDQFPVSSSSSSLMRQTPPSPPISVTHHHLHQGSLHPSPGASESIIPAITGFRELF